MTSAEDARTVDRDWESLAVDRRGGVLVVILDRPEAANARNQTMRGELDSLWRAAARDQSIRVVVLTGRGERHFCAGMDLKESGRSEGPAMRRDRMNQSRDIETLAALPQPAIAAINGYALGGGLEMALACDFRLIAETAAVGLPEVSLGLIPGGGATQRLPGLIGNMRAAELVLTSRRLTGTEAVTWGIANSVHSSSDVLSASLDLAESLASQPRRALTYAKRLLGVGQPGPSRAGLDAELDALCLLLAERQTSGDA